MYNQQSIKLIFGKIVKIKEKILFNSLTIGHLNPLASHSRSKKYNTVNFLWLNIVLTSLNIIHIREKTNFLELLKNSRKNKNLKVFYNLIGIKDFNLNTPSIGFFSDYVNYFDENELEIIMNKALNLLGKLKLEKVDFNLISIDGKDIRNCRDSNKKSINIVANKILFKSFLVDHEMTWIKDKLTDFIQENFNRKKDKNIFIGDGAYHNTRIRRFFVQKGFLAILPIKNTTKLFKKRVNTVIEMVVNQSKHKELTSFNKRNKHVIEEKVILISTKTKIYKELSQWNYLIKIITKSTCIKTDKLTVKTRLFITNVKLPDEISTVKTFRDLIRQHWQVETFHQYKDYNLLEDKYFKSRLKAGYKSIINNFSYLLQQSCNFKNKHKINNLKNSLILMIGFIFIFLAEQH